jgi:hypothetical protein
MTVAMTASDKESAKDMHSSYLGLALEHPFIAGASPFGYHLDTVKHLEDAGCAAVVLHSSPPHHSRRSLHPVM